MEGASLTMYRASEIFSTEKNGLDIENNACRTEGGRGVAFVGMNSERHILVRLYVGLTGSA